MLYYLLNIILLIEVQESSLIMCNKFQVADAEN